MPKNSKYMPWALLATALLVSIILAATLSYFLRDWLSEQSELVSSVVYVIFCLPGVLLASQAMREHKKLNEKP